LPGPQWLPGPGERLEHGGAEAALRVVVLGDDPAVFRPAPAFPPIFIISCLVNTMKP
jgi:hypothetical protein